MRICEWVRLRTHEIGRKADTPASNRGIPEKSASRSHSLTLAKAHSAIAFLQWHRHSHASNGAFHMNLGNRDQGSNGERLKVAGYDRYPPAIAVNNLFPGAETSPSPHLGVRMGAAILPVAPRVGRFQPLARCLMNGAMPSRASSSARSFWGCPAWPLTQCHVMSCRRAAASNRCHSSAFLTGFLSAVRQPLRF